jgi:hypothetical protein
MAAYSLFDNPGLANWPAIRQKHLYKQPDCAACADQGKSHVAYFVAINNPHSAPEDLDLVSLCERHFKMRKRAA